MRKKVCEFVREEEVAQLLHPRDSLGLGIARSCNNDSD